MSRNHVITKHQQLYQKGLDQCELRRSTGFIREYKNPDERDVRADDGIVSYGQRRVSKDGSIRFGGSKWQNDDLIPFAGFIIGVVMGDYWMSYIDIFWPSYPNGEWMLRLKAHEPAQVA